jgi:hypothetical protein
MPRYDEASVDRFLAPWNRHDFDGARLGQMSARGRSRLSQLVMPATRCPFWPESDRIATSRRNDAKGWPRQRDQAQ